MRIASSTADDDSGWKIGDRVEIVGGPFEHYEGTVAEIMAEKKLLQIIISIFGRPAPIELEFWQVRKQ